MRSCLSDIILGFFALLVIAVISLFFSIVVIIVFGAILIVGIFSLFERKKKKPLSVSSRATGTIDKDGNVTDFKLQGFDIVEKPKDENSSKS